MRKPAPVGTSTPPPSGKFERFTVSIPIQVFQSSRPTEPMEHSHRRWEGRLEIEIFAANPEDAVEDLLHRLVDVLEKSRQ